MKTTIFALVVFALVLLGFECTAQTTAVYNYTFPSIETLFNMSCSATPKGAAYRTSLVDVINSKLTDTTFKVSTSRMKELFSFFHYEEVYLTESGYKNSGYNASLEKMVYSLGHKWSGFAWVFRVGTYVIIVIKGDCGNILDVPVTRIQKPAATPSSNSTTTVNINVNCNCPESNNNNVPNTFTSGSGVVFIPVQEYNYNPPVVYRSNVVMTGYGAMNYSHHQNGGYNNYNPQPQPQNNGQGSMSGGRPSGNNNGQGSMSGGRTVGFGTGTGSSGVGRGN